MIFRGLIVVGAGTEAPTIDQLLSLPGITAKAVPNPYVSSFLFE